MERKRSDAARRGNSEKTARSSDVGKSGGRAAGMLGEADCSLGHCSRHPGPLTRSRAVTPASRRLARETNIELEGRAEFKISGDASTQLLMRIFDLLAQQGRTPERATVAVIDNMLEEWMATGSITAHRAEVMAEKIRSMVDTYSVQLDWRVVARRQSDVYPLRVPNRFWSSCRSSNDCISSSSPLDITPRT